MKHIRLGPPINLMDSEAYLQEKLRLNTYLNSSFNLGDELIYLGISLNRELSIVNPEFSLQNPKFLNALKIKHFEFKVVRDMLFLKIKFLEENKSIIEDISYFFEVVNISKYESNFIFEEIQEILEMKKPDNVLAKLLEKFQYDILVFGCDLDTVLYLNHK